MTKTCFTMIEIGPNGIIRSYLANRGNSLKCPGIVEIHLRDWGAVVRNEKVFYANRVHSGLPLSGWIEGVEVSQHPMGGKTLTINPRIVNWVKQIKRGYEPGISQFLPRWLKPPKQWEIRDIDPSQDTGYTNGSFITHVEPCRAIVVMALKKGPETDLVVYI